MLKDCWWETKEKESRLEVWAKTRMEVPLTDMGRINFVLTRFLPLQSKRSLTNIKFMPEIRHYN